VGSVATYGGYSLAIATARTWGLYISTGRGMTTTGVEEPPLFSEPGVFLVRPDRTFIGHRCSPCRSPRPHFRRLWRHSTL